MNGTASPLKVFVAMPYSTFGRRAKRTKPADVEALYRDACDALSTKVSRPVELTIEKYRPESGLVHESMFRALYDADIVIADLTGANANVFFEVGVRYGVRRGLTILTSQDEKTLFDLSGMRIIRYANRLDRLVIDDIVQAVEGWLKERAVADSPVLRLLDLEVVPRERWQRVAEERVRRLLAAARTARTSDERLRLTLQAVEDDPYSAAARIGCVEALRKAQDHARALEVADRALEWFPAEAGLHKERGLVLDRLSQEGEDRLDDAADALERAIRFASEDSDTHCCLGGVLRRRALRRPASREEDLRAALRHYERALDLARHDTYAGLNLLRLWFLLAPYHQQAPEATATHLRRMYHLCEFEVAEAERRRSGEVAWRLFDLGDTLILSERRDEGLARYDDAIARIPALDRTENLLSPLRAWQELMVADVFPGHVRQGVEAVVKMIEEARRAPRP